MPLTRARIGSAILVFAILAIFLGVGRWAAGGFQAQVGASSSGDSNNSVGFCAPVCGDGIIMRPEECDDRNTTNGDGCSSTCQKEEDDGSSSSGGQSSGGQSSGAQSSDVHSAAGECGDGTRQPTEQCDDGNVTDGDGCDSSCNTEEGWRCEPPESASSGGGTSGGGSSGGATFCGDGLCQAGEGCLTSDVSGPECLAFSPCAADCSFGRQTVASCVDTDGGRQPKFYSIAGEFCKVWGENGTLIEAECVSPTELRWYPESCNCQSGTCIIPNGPAPGTQACNDPDGEDIRVAASMTGNGQRYDDECHPVNGGLVLEGYCLSGQPSQKLMACPFGYKCSNGACTVQDPLNTQTGCTDTDGGINLGTQGEVYDPPLGDASAKDVCVTATVVREYYCINGQYTLAQHYGIGAADISCPSGTTCDKGACQ